MRPKFSERLLFRIYEAFLVALIGASIILIKPIVATAADPWQSESYDAEHWLIESYLKKKRNAEANCDARCRATRRFRRKLYDYSGKGTFFGELLLKPLSDGLTMQVTAEFGYVDAMSRKWSAKPGDKTDGASIPRAVWSLIGGPFSGKYRRAAVIHDQYCVRKTRSWQDTHNNLYDVMIASGVGRIRATIIYYAVYRFGPRWGCPKGHWCSNGELYNKSFNEKEFDKVKQLIEVGTLDKEDIQTLVQILDATLWDATPHFRYR